MPFASAVKEHAEHVEISSPLQYAARHWTLSSFTSILAILSSVRQHHRHEKPWCRQTAPLFTYAHQQLATVDPVSLTFFFIFLLWYTNEKSRLPQNGTETDVKKKKTDYGMSAEELSTNARGWAEAAPATYFFAGFVADFFAFATRVAFALRRASRFALLRRPFAAAVSRFTYGFRRRRRRRFLMPFVGFW